MLAAINKVVYLDGFPDIPINPHQGCLSAALVFWKEYSANSLAVLSFGCRSCPWRAWG